MDASRKVPAFFEIYLKGLCIGVANIVPGLSWSTLALVVGVYERFIFAIGTISPRWIWYLLRGKTTRARRDFAAIDFALFIPLILGIATTLFLFSEILLYVRVQFPSPAVAFFLGIMLASLYFTLCRMKRITFSRILSFCIGFASSYLLLFIPEFTADHDLFSIFISSFFAIGVMVLPGVSGAFLLTVMGQCQYIFDAFFVSDSTVILVFLAGALGGIMFCARLVAWFLARHRSVTILFLLGMMFGAFWRYSQQIIVGEFSLIGIFWMVIGFVLVVFVRSVLLVRPRSPARV